MNLKELTEFYLKEQKLDGLVSEDCGCALGDLMPCDEPQPDCKAVRLETFGEGVDCHVEDCEWNGQPHWHERQPAKPEPAKCSECGGAKKVYSSRRDESVTCEKCNGSGLAPQPENEGEK